MKLSFFTLLWLFLTVDLLWAHTGKSQNIDNVKVMIGLQSEPLKSAFRQIEQQSNFKFAYVEDQVSAYTSLSLSKKSRTVRTTLEQLLANTSLKFVVRNNTVVVMQKEESAGTANSAGRESPAEIMTDQMTDRVAVNYKRMVSGIVTNENGEPLVGASIAVKGSTILTMTDGKGQFSIDVPEGNAVLVISYSGYNAKEVTIGSNNILSVALIPNNNSMEDVVVVGYGKVRRSDLTGAVSKVGESAIKATPIVALDRAMQGRVAGVQVTTNSGRPGSGTTIRIRGTGSVNASNEPLYVIDGFPTGDLNSINPNDIESIEILKDASATAIYGSRGSNGVVIVTTKRGKAGQSNIQFESYYGVQSVRKKLPLLNAREYAEYLNEARVNGGSQPYFNGSAPDRPLPSSFSEGTDWQDEVFRNAPIQNYQLTFSGGEQKTRYAISGSYFDQSGIVVNSRFKRFTLRANLDRDISSRIKVGLSMQAARVNSNAIRSDVDGGTAAGVTTAAMNYLPIFPVYNNSGQYFKDQTTLNPFPVDNPVAIANEVRNRIFTNRVLANTYLDVKLLEGLVFRTTLGGDLLDNKNNYYASRNTFLSGGIGSASIIADQSFNWLSENTLTYSKTFLENHSITALLGYTYQEANYEGVTANATNFTSDFASYNNLGAGATLVAPASGATQWALLSYLSRINYSYSNRYLLTLTARRDGSSRFGPTNKFGFFPSGAFAWRIANESFMSGQNIFSDLKLRVSYGLTGNQEIGDYRFLPALNSPTYIFGGPTGSRFIGAVPGGISNLDLQWEKNAQFDVGLDMALLRGRLNITVDYYNKRTSDLLFNVNVPLTTGFGSALKNIGSVENKGWELEISSINLDNRNLSWRTSLNLAQNKNKVLKLDGRPEFLSGLGSGHLQISNPILMRVGIPLGSFYGRIMDGIFQNQQEVDKSAQPSAKPGDIRYRDLNNDGVINDNDRTVIGNGYPKLIGGLDNTINYKGFELNVFLNGSYGNKILNLTRFDLYSLNGQQQAKEVVNRWTPTNPSNTIPRANIGGGQKILSTFQIEDGSYLRLRNLSLGYNLPSGALKRLALSSMKIYVSAQNLLTFTNYSGYDPEINFQGTNSISQSLDYGGYPAAKTFLVGLNMRF